MLACYLLISASRIGPSKAKRKKEKGQRRKQDGGKETEKVKKLLVVGCQCLAQMSKRVLE